MSDPRQPGTWWVQVETKTFLHIVCECGQELRVAYEIVEGGVLPPAKCFACSKLFTAHLEGWDPKAIRPRSPATEI